MIAEDVDNHLISTILKNNYIHSMYLLKTNISIKM